MPCKRGGVPPHLNRMNEAKYKKLVLVKPPERSAVDFGAFSMAVLAAAVRHITDVTVIDATDMTPAHAVERVWALKPDLVGITLMGLPSVPPGTAFIGELLTGGPPGFPIIVGGHGAALIPGTLLEAGADGVVIGEGENTLREIIQKGITPGMAGTAVRVDGRVITGPPQTLISPLDDLEKPARDLIPPPGDGIHLMETSRGCPHRCAFCETTRFFGVRWRPHSAERVVEEVRRIIDEYDGWMIHVADDNFTASSRRIKKICELLIKEDVLPAYFMFSARADDLISDPELLPSMARARMLRVQVGIDTLDSDVGRSVEKTISIDTYRKAFDRMRELGMFSVGSLIVGLPGESAEARERAVELAVRAGPDSAHFLPYLPLPGLPREKRHTGFDPHPGDVTDSRAFTSAFLLHPEVRARLETLARGEDIQGQLARGTLQKIKEREKRDSH